MSMNKKLPDYFSKDHPVGAFLLEWHHSLSDTRKADRAELKRCKTLQQIQQSSAYQKCYWQLINKFDHPPGKQQLALALAVAVHIRENISFGESEKGGKTKPVKFGHQLARGTNLNSKTDKPKVSELRFRRLLRIKDREKLFPYLCSLIRFLDGKVNLLAVQECCFYWGDKYRTNLAYEYYDKANLETKES